MERVLGGTESHGDAIESENTPGSAAEICLALATAQLNCATLLSKGFSRVGS